MTYTSPIDIKKSGECSLKCMYWFHYGLSSCRIENRDEYIRVYYDGASDVVYNSVKYTPEEIRIYCPSLHTYEGKTAPSEMIIIHKSNQGMLMVCVPILTTTASITSIGSTLVSTFIEKLPTKEEGTLSLQLSDFNLDNLVPKAPYYSYQGTPPFSNDMECDFIVYAPVDGGVYINDSTLELLQKNISPSQMDIEEGKAYFNKTGSTKNGFSGEGQIYIDCQPVSESNEIVYEEPKEISTPDTTQSLNWIYSVLSIIIGAIFVIMSYKLFRYVLKYMFPDIPNATSPKK